MCSVTKKYCKLVFSSAIEYLYFELFAYSLVEDDNYNFAVDVYATQ